MMKPTPHRTKRTRTRFAASASASASASTSARAQARTSLIGFAALCLAGLTAIPSAVSAQVSAPTSTQRTLDRIVAIVENETITERQLLESIGRTRAVLAQQNREVPDERALAPQILQQMIIKQLKLQEAKRLGITIDDITLDRTLAEMAQRNQLSLAEFKRKVESDNRNFQTLREEIRDELAIQRLVQREVINRIEVSEKEINDVLLSNRADSSIEYHLAHIRMPPQDDDTTGDDADDADDAAKQRLTRVRQGLRSVSLTSLDSLNERLEQLWETVAEEDNLEELSYEVEDLGWRHAEDLPAPVHQHIEALQNNATSPVISNDEGLHLFQLLASRSDNPEVMQLQYHVRHILIRPNPIDDDEKIQDKLLDIKQRIEDGADFETLACEYSQDNLSAMKGGDLGWASPQSYVPEFAEAVTRTRGGDGIVGPIKSSFGWHLLEVLGTREQDIGDDAARQQAVIAIRKGKTEEETGLWLLKLRENLRVEVRI